MRQRTNSFWVAAALSVPVVAGGLWSGVAAAQGSESRGRAPGSQYWEAGVHHLGIDPAEDDFFWGVDVQGNAIFVSGERGPGLGGSKKQFVAKFLTNGRDSLTLDTSFGTGGIVDIDLSTYAGTPDDPATPANDADPAIEASRGVRVQADGKIVFVGIVEDPADTAPTRATQTVLVLGRLNPDGSVDGTFGTSGFTVVDVGQAVSSGGEGGAQDESAWGLEIDSLGRPLVSLGATALANPQNRTDRDRYALRFTANGALDTTWGTTGIVSFDTFGGNNDNQRHGLALPGDGLLSVGYTNLAGRNQLVLAKFTSAGAFDSTFSGDGVLRVTPFPVGFAEGYDAARLSDGSYVTTGYGNLYSDAPPTGVPPRGTDAVQFHITADGSFDSEFGEHGAVAFNVNNSNDRGRTLVALGDDTIVVGGTAIPAGAVAPGAALNPEDALLFALRPNGRLRNDFAPAGYRLFDFGGADEEFYNSAVGVLPPGNRGSQRFLVAAGYSRQGSQANGQGVLVVLPIPQRHVR